MPFGFGPGPGGPGPGGPMGPGPGPGGPMGRGPGGFFGRRGPGFGRGPGGPWGPPPPPPRRGCYIATAVYGSYDCPQVWTLRRYRDQVLDQSLPGRMFITLYYALSPTFVRIFGSNRLIMKPFRLILDRAVVKLNQSGFQDTPYQDKDY